VNSYAPVKEIRTNLISFIWQSPVLNTSQALLKKSVSIICLFFTLHIKNWILFDPFHLRLSRLFLKIQLLSLHTQQSKRWGKDGGGGNAPFLETDDKGKWKKIANKLISICTCTSLYPLLLPLFKTSLINKTSSSSTVCIMDKDNFSLSWCLILDSTQFSPNIAYFKSGQKWLFNNQLSPFSEGMSECLIHFVVFCWQVNCKVKTYLQ